MRSVWMTILLFGLIASSVLSASSQQTIHSDLVITLERTQCFGWCPAYLVTISSDGVVKFTPQGDHVYRGDGDKPKSPMVGVITKMQLDELLTEFEKIKFYSLRKKYGSKEKFTSSQICPENWTDQPSATISIVNNRKKKTVYHYLGCQGSQTLKNLEALEDKIDEIVDVKKWTSQYGWGTGSVTDLKLTVERLPVSKP